MDSSARVDRLLASNNLVVLKITRTFAFAALLKHSGLALRKPKSDRLVDKNNTNVL
jgi:hypothetical protein